LLRTDHGQNQGTTEATDTTKKAAPRGDDRNLLEGAESVSLRANCRAAGYPIDKKTMKRTGWVVGTVFLAMALAAGQERPEEGGHELEVWTGGGHSVPGGTKDTSVWNAGVRYGWILTAPHGPGFLCGRFEYAVDAVPAFVVFQPANTAFGAGLNPIALKWIFATRGDAEPYLELNGGTLFTNHEVPSGTIGVNFTSSGAVGVHFLGSRAWTIEARFMHISNAGLTVPNPGINTVQVRVGFGKFFGKK
jgi:Lipid A 3-O-deacylase (PagL)